MKVYKNIEKAKNFKPELKKVIDDLIPLRSSRKATEAYYDKHLENDWAYSKWLDDKQDWELHVHSNKKFPDFKLPKGAISPESARAFRKVLLEVISDDKYSFGYLYFLLASEENREASMVLYPCVPEEIDYAIQFDIDEIGKEIDAIDDLDEKIIRLIQWKTDSDNNTEYEGELKIRFNKWIVNRIDNIELEKKHIQESPKPAEGSNSGASKTEEKNPFEKLSLEQIDYLYTNLKDEFFECEIETLLHLFGYTPTNSDYAPILWKKTKQNLRELLVGLKKDDCTIADVERCTPRYFIDRQGEPIKLAKNKKVPSLESDYIEQILKNLATID